MDHADDCLICSRERKAAMRSFGPTADRGPFCSAIGPTRGIAMMSNLGARAIARVAVAILMSLAMVFVMMATAETPASARRVRVKRSLPGAFVGPSDFACYWVDRTAQYFCQEKRTDKTAKPPIGFALEAENPGDVGLFPGETPPGQINANNFIRPRSLSCSLTGNDADQPAAYGCAYRYDEGKTFRFTLDKALAIIVEDDKTNEISIDTWFMPRYK
jgi:hypothetical protein